MIAQSLPRPLAAPAALCLAAGAAAILSAPPARCQPPTPRTLVQWDFETNGQTDGWTAPEQVEFAAVDGSLIIVSREAGAAVKSPPFELKPALLQYIEVRLQASEGGIAAFRWESTPRAGPPIPGRRNVSGAPFVIVGDRRPHEYRVLPFWHGAPDVRRLVFSPPEACPVSVDWIRIVQLDLPKANEPWWDFAQQGADFGWQALGGVKSLALGPAGLAGRTETAQPLLISPALATWASAYPWAAVRLRSDRRGRASLGWVAEGRDGLRQEAFDVRGDGQFHTYNLELSHHPDWRGKIILLTLEPLAQADVQFEVEYVRLAREPQGPPEFEVTELKLEHRGEGAQRFWHVTCTVTNVGPETARNVRATFEPPEALKLLGRPTLIVPEIPYNVTKQFVWQVEPPAGPLPAGSRARVTLEADNALPIQVEAAL